MKMAKNPGIIQEIFTGSDTISAGVSRSAVIAVIILLVGRGCQKAGENGARFLEQQGKVEAGVVSFLSSFVKYALYFVLAMIILGQFGVTTSSVIAVLGSAGLTMGLALQGAFLILPVVF